ncbi:MAG: hypothetical protein QM523_07795, partial [Candidatus Pacebacteria bacterium]|nr:hypothetical protein [Candidatus Paceibacterota bacterium]
MGSSFSYSAGIAASVLEVVGTLTIIRLTYQNRIRPSLVTWGAISMSLGVAWLNVYLESGELFIPAILPTVAAFLTNLTIFVFALYNLLSSSKLSFKKYYSYYQ